jgi:flagellar motor protein MotB
MKRYFFVLLVLAVAFALSCETAPVKTEVPTGNVFVATSNESLAKIPVKGFGYKQSAVPAQEWDQWAETAAPVVKGILDKLPKGYSLQVTGHADARGPEDPMGKKPGNIKISTDRAKAVYDSLKSKGIDSPNLTYKGVGSSEITPDCDPREACQRRVTFKVVPQE